MNPNDIPNFTCPDCGQPRRGEGVCPDIESIRANVKKRICKDRDLFVLLASFDFQKARAEKALARVRELEEALETWEERKEHFDIAGKDWGD